MTNKAAIIAIGTEVTSGEITNRNGAWLAERLQKFGVETILHLAVPDDHALMTSAMNYAASHANLLFLTGGLGPTSDDFTREVVGDWLNEPLYFSEPVWEQLVEQYSRQGLKIREAHKRQCYFPQNTRLLSNTVGTAHGFVGEKGDKRVFVLPGPPREIEGMWTQSVVDELKALNLKLETELKVWRCFGVPESEVAEVVEKELAGSGLQVGYRASVPYVLVKVWLPRTKEAFQWQEKLDKLLSSWTVGEEKKDLAYLWLESLRPFEKVQVLDQATGGRLGARLHELFKAREFDLKDVVSKLTLLTRFAGSEEGELQMDASDSLISFGVQAKPDANQYEVWTKTRHGVQRDEFEIPLRLFSNNEKARLYISEHVFKVWLSQLSGA